MLTDRKRKILEAIINDFVNFAQPVGSRTISKKYLIGISPATIRNEMADLEELGFLLQPHTSAGRIPTDLGYRIFVDAIETFGIKNRNQLPGYKEAKSLLYNRSAEPLEIAEKALALLQETTGCAAVISLPSFIKASLENLKLIRVSNSKVLMILVSARGTVRSAEINNIGLGQKELDIISDKLLADFKGKSIEDINIRSMRSLRLIPEAEYFIPSIKMALKSVRENRLLVSGAGELIVNAGITSQECAKNILTFMDSQEDLEAVIGQILEEGPADRVLVKIGEEFEEKILHELSVVAKRYSTAFVAVVGPKRMDYEAVGALVEYTSKSLSQAFTGINL